MQSGSWLALCFRCNLFWSHTGANIAEELKEAAAEWQLERQKQGISVVTDSARKMDVSVREAGLAGVDVTTRWNSSLDMLELLAAIITPVKSTHWTTWTSVMPRTS